MTRDTLVPALSIGYPARLSIVIAVVTSIFALTSGGVLAAPATVLQDRGTHAFLETGDCFEMDGSITCVMERIEVSQQGNTSQVCVYISTTSNAVDGETMSVSEFGCTTTLRSVFSIDGRLNTATLEPVTVPTTITVEECDLDTCTETTTKSSVTVSATWTGYDDVARFQDQNVIHNGTCTTSFSGSGQFREATATASIDGTTIGTSYARLTKARSTLVITPTCPPLETENAWIE